ncbi:MAG: OmpA family protein [Piscirickettsiaceae bacterium]|nr:OmpA family protein [Piscirickettsiaceae bacterium]
MKISTKLIAAVLAIGLLAGCAGPNKQVQQDNLFCAIAGGLAGGVAAGIAVDGGQAAVASALVGAGLALILCQNDDVAVADETAVAAVCTETPPAGALLDAKGCAFDTDGDGVVDGIDMCAGTPEGVAVDRVGCALDSDKDGVADYQDMCPSTLLGTIVDKTGCPIPGQNILSLSGVNFAFDKATLTDDAKGVLMAGVTAVRALDSVIEVRVEGHTDSRGSAEYNAKLSQQRAEAVVAYLVEQGVDANRLIPLGMGELHPVANNDTEAGRAANRRVDFVISH